MTAKFSLTFAHVAVLTDHLQYTIYVKLLRHTRLPYILELAGTKFPRIVVAHIRKRQQNSGACVCSIASLKHIDKQIA